jgi:hypothetical protein
MSPLIQFSYNDANITSIILFLKCFGSGSALDTGGLKRAKMKETTQPEDR